MRKVFLSRNRHAILAIFVLTGVAKCLAATPQIGDIVISSPEASSLIRFTIVTPKGFVGFSVPKNWKVLSMSSKPPVAVAAFLAANPADDGTPDSTNIAIELIQPDSDQGRHALGNVGKAYEGDVQPSSRSGWDCYAQDAHQKKTLYTILDGKKSVADMIVWVRVAWPHLLKNEPGYDAGMKVVFNTLLDAVDGALGAYEAKPGDVVRRPE